jgi:hypothetical protein
MATPSHFICKEKENTYNWVNECYNDYNDWPENVYFVSEQAEYFMIFKEENAIHVYKCDEDATFKKYPIANLYICKDDESAFVCYTYMCSYKIKSILTATCPPSNGVEDETGCFTNNIAAFMAELDVPWSRNKNLDYAVSQATGTKTYLSIVSTINEITTTSDILTFCPKSCGDSVSYSYAIDAEYIYLLSQNCKKILLTEYPLNTKPFDPYRRD